MYFSRIQMQIDSVYPGKAARLLKKSVYHEHKMVWDFFDEDKEKRRDFLFRRFDLGKVCQYFILSNRIPVNDQGIWSIETKEFNPKIKKGDKFHFNLRVNPVVTKRIDTNKETKKRKRDDVYMEAIAHYKLKPIDERPSNNEILVEAGQKWLREKAEKNGFDVKENQFLVEGYSRLQGSKDRNNNLITLGVIDYSGILTVIDADKFYSALVSGIGKAKAFGCGLLLLKKF